MLCQVDIRDLIGLDEVMEDLDFGPNGGLIYCFECACCASIQNNLIRSFCAFRYLLENLDWLYESLGDYDDDYLIIDCPGAFGRSPSASG